MRAAGVTEPHRCPAHGRTIDEHTDEYAGDCTALPTRPAPDALNSCGDCEFYAATQMHWDTCPQRGRNRPRDLATHWRREAERLKVRADELQKENDALALQLRARQETLTARQASASDPEIMALAHIVGELQRLDEAERGRTLRYLNHRYAPSGEPVTRVGGLVRGPIALNTPGGPPPLA